MLYPSIDSLLEQVPSKYMLVTIAAKRAREMHANKDYFMDQYVSQKNVGKSLEEIYKGFLNVDPESFKDVYEDSQKKEMELKEFFSKEG